MPEDIHATITDSKGRSADLDSPEGQRIIEETVNNTLFSSMNIGTCARCAKPGQIRDDTGTCIDCQADAIIHGAPAAQRTALMTIVAIHRALDCAREKITDPFGPDLEQLIADMAKAKTAWQLAPLPAKGDKKPFTFTIGVRVELWPTQQAMIPSVTWGWSYKSIHENSEELDPITDKPDLLTPAPEGSTD